MADAKHDNGGQAYPRGYSQMLNGEQVFPQDGMTLEDYFAGQALAAIITETMDAAWQRDIPAPEFTRKTCFAAYNFGAAMIAEKRRREKEDA
jgi:hypothetical protein